MILIIIFFVPKPNYQAIVHFIDCRWRFTCNYMESTWKLHVKFYMGNTWEIQEQNVFWPWNKFNVISRVFPVNSFPCNSHEFPCNPVKHGNYMGLHGIFTWNSRVVPTGKLQNRTMCIAPSPQKYIWNFEYYSINLYFIFYIHWF